jgi:hypothetical protein
VGSGKLADATELDHLLLAVDMTWNAKLEAVLHLLDPAMPMPRLSVKPTMLHFGTARVGDRRNQQLYIENLSRGWLSGEITLDNYQQGILLDSYVIEGNAVTLQVSLEPLASVALGHHRNVLHLRSNGGNLDIPLLFILRAPPEENIPWWQRVLDRFWF